MKLSIFILFFATAVFSACLSASAAFDDEPIPDFGPEGPVGYTPRDSDLESSANTANERPGTDNRPFFEMRAALRGLGLDIGQWSAIRDLLEQFAEDGGNLRSEMARVQETLQTVRRIGGDESDVKNAQQSMRKLSREGRNLQAQFRKAISQILSEEQFKAFNRIQQARRNQAERRAKP